jgi:hypothetical protein
MSELLDCSGATESAATDLEGGECRAKDVEEISILREDNCFRTWIMLADP